MEPIPNQNQTPASSSSRSLFEKYQVFFAIVLCGFLIGGAIVTASITRLVSDTSEKPQQTRDTVRSDLVKLVSRLDMNKKEFAACLDNGTMTQKISDASALADKSGVTGTPTFFVIKRTFGANDAVTSQKQIAILGARDLATYENAIATMKSPTDQPAVTGAKIELSAEDHWTGPRRAEIVIVEYSDIDCPFCKAAKPIIDELLRKHPDYAFVYRHAPITSLHPFAAYKAEASECAAAQGGDEKFFKFLDAVVK